MIRMCYLLSVSFQNLNLFWDEANSRLRLNNNGVHSAFWIAYSLSRSSYRLCLRPWALVLGRHGYYNRRLLLYPMSPPGCMLDHWVAFIPPEMEVILIYSSKCGWLSQKANISLFQFYGSCLKGQVQKWTTAQKEKVLFIWGGRYWVSKLGYIQLWCWADSIL